MGAKWILVILFGMLGAFRALSPRRHGIMFHFHSCLTPCVDSELTLTILLVLDPDDNDGTKFGIYVPIGYRAVDDTITPEFFSEYMDTVFLYTIVGSDTLYYRSKDLTDLESYYLQPVGVLESGTQYFSFMVDVSSSDFY